MGISTAGKSIAVKFVAGRKENGNTVEITITEKTENTVTNIAAVETTSEDSDKTDTGSKSIAEEVAELDTDDASAEESIFQS